MSVRVPPTIPGPSHELPPTPLQYQSDTRLETFGPGPERFHSEADEIPDQVYTPADELAQVTPVGGLDIAGRPVAGDPVPVLVVGVVRTREQVPLTRSSNSIAVAGNSNARLIGATPQRRTLYVVSAAAGLVLCDNSQQAGQALGMPLPANTVFPVTDTGDVWVANTTGAPVVIGYWQTADVG